jgi:hypothetical protein
MARACVITSAISGFSEVEHNPACSRGIVDSCLRSRVFQGVALLPA